MPSRKATSTKTLTAKRGPATAGTASVVKIGPKRCRPFLLQVMVFSPEAGYKFEVVVEKGCTPENDAIWKLVFDLYKQKRDGFDQIVHVSFTAGTAEESEGVKRMALQGVSDKQADLLTGPVYDAAKALEGVPAPTPEHKQKIRTAMSKVTTVDL
jgi:hypothetical protein